MKTELAEHFSHNSPVFSSNLVYLGNFFSCIQVDTRKEPFSETFHQNSNVSKMLLTLSDLKET
jgi:hypothetical protein